MSKKPEPKDFPPESPHDLEWGGYNHTKYQIALAQWEAAENRKSNFFSRQDIGGVNPDDFHRDLQIANLKREKAELLEALTKCEQYFDNIADVEYGDERFVPNKEMKLLTMIRETIKKVKP